MVSPSAVDGELVFDTAAINKGYEKTDALLAEFFSRGYTVNYVYSLCSDGTAEELDRIPSAKEMVEKSVSLIDPELTNTKDIHYLAEMTSPDGKPMCFMVYFGGWHSVTLGIYYHTGTPRCTHRGTVLRISGQCNGTHATVCEGCYCVINGTIEAHYDDNRDTRCDRCDCTITA